MRAHVLTPRLTSGSTGRSPQTAPAATRRRSQLGQLGRRRASCGAGEIVGARGPDGAGLERSGATLSTALRAGWSGQTLGQGNASSETTRKVKGGAVRQRWRS